MPSHEASTRRRPRPWRYPGPVLCRRKTDLRVCESVEKKRQQHGRDRSVPKIRPMPQARRRGPCCPSLVAHEISWPSRSHQLAINRGLDTFLHRCQCWLVAISPQYIHQLCAVGGKTPPAIRLRDLSSIGLIEAHARQYGSAGGFNAPGVAHAVGVRLDLGARHSKQWHTESTAFT